MLRQCVATILLLVCAGIGSAFAETSSDPVSEIKRLQKMRGTDERKPEVVQIRADVITEAAYTLGVQSGVCWRNGLRLKVLERFAHSLDRIFNFTPLLLQGDVVPPVIIEAGAGLRIENDTTATSVIRNYKIMQDARFVSVPPSWRDYLMTAYDPPETINRIILPKNSDEQTLWNLHVERGFHDGIRQADLLYETQLNTLVRDYRGCLRFVALSRQGIVSIPQISRGVYDITINGKELAIGERIFRVTGTEFQKVEAWKP